jgi:hypothetical protein
MPDEQTSTTQTTQPASGDQSQAQQTESTQETWEQYIQSQPPEVKQRYEEHIAGLRNTVKSTRQERDDLAKAMRDAAAKAEKGSEAEKSLTEIAGKLEQAERRAAFFEDATTPEIGCRNPRAAFALAQAEQLFDRKGNPDWATIKATAPELFGTYQPKSNAGNGTESPPAKTGGMNDWIRTAAGRK